MSINTPLGMNVTLNCISSDNVVKIEWTKDGIQLFLHSPLWETKNKTKTNFTSERMSVDPATLGDRLLCLTGARRCHGSGV